MIDQTRLPTELVMLKCQQVNQVWYAIARLSVRGRISIGSAGAKNAALLAIQILARKDEKLAAAYRKFKKDQADAVAKRNAKVQDKL